MSYLQRRRMHDVLSAALSPGGYQTVLAVMNRQRIISELEDPSLANASLVRKIRDALQSRNLTYPPVPTSTVFEIAEWLALDVRSGTDPFLNNTYTILAGAIPSFTTLSEISQMDTVEVLRQATVDWFRKPRGIKKRREEFCDYSIAIFVDDYLLDANPANHNMDGSGYRNRSFALRFEGHHLSVNVAVSVDRGSPSVVAHSTPLFIGAFPMVVLPAPNLPPGSNVWQIQTAWTQGQSLGLQLSRDLRQFWLSLPEAIVEASYMNAAYFPQNPPLIMLTPTTFQSIAGPCFSRVPIRDASLHIEYVGP
ncbi:hypothetical protein CYMTET_7507 [Cymbomonas tetramitiformis]|uniref:Uncharacterized protein n=1 Tax=Cymbomonas tetramitiformis TaxID=36881 RepID=A0AAE0LHE1_9CHLO|nr:hypothetical protein CYMTET_7507 [Cymbomonas tetramitiformis]|eukprot:gene22542-27206_t